MSKYLTVGASFIIMLCIGSVYAWSIIATELIAEFGFSASQTQLIFGALIAIFPVTMILVGQLGRRVNHRILGYISGFFLLSGYTLASFSEGNFILILTGIGIMGGIATGFGYWVAITLPVKWFPDRKGLITGVAAAGFGLGAVFMSEIAGIILKSELGVMQLLRVVGISYGIIILLFSNFIKTPTSTSTIATHKVQIADFIFTKTFRRLFIGILLGTFAGLLIIGSLGLIGNHYNIPASYLIHGVALFAVANFAGRLTWGFFSDNLGANLTIFLALLLQSLSIASLVVFNLSGFSFLTISFLIGFGFGGNFVLFAKETAQVFGVDNLGLIYPYVFLGYAIAGILGPMSGGALFDLSGSFTKAIILASLISLAGSILFLNQVITLRKNEPSQ